MLLGPPMPQLRASARLTSGSASGGWPTPRATDGEKNVRTPEGARAEAMRSVTGGDLAIATALLLERRHHPSVVAGWPTPSATASESVPVPVPGTTTDGRRPDGTKATVSVGYIVRQLTGWATPTNRDTRDDRATPEFLARRMERPNGKNLSLEAILTGWETPQTNWASKGYRSAQWREGKEMLSPTEALVIGDRTESPTDLMAAYGVLATEFSLWLMGYPSAWDRCAPGFLDWMDWQALLALLPPSNERSATAAAS